MDDNASTVQTQLQPQDQIFESGCFDFDDGNLLAENETLNGQLELKKFEVERLRAENEEF